ncbi:type II secretion system F family protein, partial [Methanobrevibacter sp. OttesenSCG-928-I08]|nr:type II secretion system F family protein [Methanobrevibacter sp. OttesenSCG-928-I08]
MVEIKIISLFADFLEDKIPEKQILYFQEFLLSAGIVTVASKVLSIIILFFLFLELILFVFNSFFNLNIVIFTIPFVFIIFFISYIIIISERRKNEIEEASPDFLRQLSSVLRVGLSFENAMENISNYGSGPLYDEIRRTIIEIKMGKNFDDAWISLTSRLNSKELERIFNIILEGRKSGASLSNVLEDISNDLREMMVIKRERRASVMMPVMFLIISAIIATPFSLGMVSIYSNFMENLGQSGQLISTAVLAGELYVIIHSVLVGFIIGLILYGDFKKGLKFSIPLTIVAYS